MITYAVPTGFSSEEFQANTCGTRIVVRSRTSCRVATSLSTMSLRTSGSLTAFDRGHLAIHSTPSSKEIGTVKLNWPRPESLGHGDKFCPELVKQHLTILGRWIPEAPLERNEEDQVLRTSNTSTSIYCLLGGFLMWCVNNWKEGHVACGVRPPMLRLGVNSGLDWNYLYFSASAYVYNVTYIYLDFWESAFPWSAPPAAGYFCSRSSLTTCRFTCNHNPVYIMPVKLPEEKTPNRRENEAKNCQSLQLTPRSGFAVQHRPFFVVGHEP